VSGVAGEVNLGSGGSGRVSTSGSFTYYAVPQGRTLQDITAGPDRALWVTDSGNNKIARITTSGSITEYGIPTAASTPGGICPGPDGNLWNVENSTGNKKFIRGSSTLLSLILTSCVLFSSPLFLPLFSSPWDPKQALGTQYLVSAQSGKIPTKNKNDPTPY
jgi:hypothetical protein